MTRRLEHRFFGALAALAFAAAASSATAMPKPRYPIRKEDLPSRQAPPPEPAARPQRDPEPQPQPEPRRPVTRGAPSEAVTATELPPPGPAPAPPEPMAPPSAVAAPDAVTLRYAVAPGDTLYGVSRRFGVNVRRVMELNNLTPEAGLKSGQMLRLPDGARDLGLDPFATGTVNGMAPPAPPLRSEPVRPAPPPVREEPAAPPAAPAQRPASPSPEGSDAFPTAAQIRALGKGRFLWPVRGDVVSSYGALGPGLRNDGLNIASPQGTPVRSAADGEVVYAGSSAPGFGNLVLLKHADGWVTVYGHLSSISVRMRDRVTQGQTLGAVGQTGGVDRPQLHFEVRYAPNSRVKASPVDPRLVLP